MYSPIFTRVALRYLNNINFPTGDTYDFGQFIKPSLLAATNDFKSFGFTRSIGVMNMVDDEQDILSNFTYGFVNSLFPNKIAKREFILDYDCFTNLKNTIDAIKPLVLKLRNKANELFNKSILPELKPKWKTMDTKLLHELNEINARANRTSIDLNQPGATENTLLDALKNISSDKSKFEDYTHVKQHERILGEIQL